MDNTDKYEPPEDNDVYSDDGEDDSEDYSSYDDAREEDRGDANDIADEMAMMEDRRLQEKEDKRYEDYEIMADQAALRGIDVVEPINPYTSASTLGVSKESKGLRKGRTVTKGLKVSKPMHLKIDEQLRPIDEWQHKYGQQAKFCMRKLNINWKWKDVNKGMKKLMWEDTKNQFHISDDEELRKKFLSLVSKRFRDFKGKLVSGWITKTEPRTNPKEPPEIWKHIRVEDWKLFVQIQNSDEAKRKREKAVASAKKNEHFHRLGQKTFNAARTVWIKDGFYPGITPVSLVAKTGNESTSEITIKVNRADDWYCAMHSKDKKTGKYMVKKPKTKEVIDKYLEIRDKQTQGEFVPDRNKDALYYALGEKEDHPSRARGFGGFNITVKQAFGSSVGSSSGSKKMMKHLEDREALKKELREELRNEMKMDLKSSLSSVLEQMGLPALHLPDATDTSPCRPQVNLVQPSQPSLPPQIKDDTPCRLFIEDSHNGVLYEVARGKIFQGEVCHGDSVTSDKVRVKVSVVLEEFQTLPLPVPVPAYDVNLLIDAVGNFVLWPISLVRLDDDEGKKRKRNEKGCHEVLGSNSHHSRLSVTPIKGHTQELMVESLSPDCQWLKTLIGLTANEETFTIHLDANLFYYNESGKIQVHKDDLKQFLERSELNISIMQILMRAIRDDLVQLNTKTQIGWLCPDATADTKSIKKAEGAIAYITSAFNKSALNGDEFILAPIIDSKHWTLLAICPQSYTIYEFDSITLKEGRKLYMRMVVLSALKRFKMSGGQIKAKRIKPLWKSMKCPQQSGDAESGYYVMRFMYDIVKSCTTVDDLEKVWNKQNEESYTDVAINEIRDKWATYFTSRCVT